MIDTLDYVFNPQTDTLNNPIPILQQQKAEITTNPFIKSPKVYDTTSSSTSTPKVNSQLSIALIGFMDDCFSKPDDIEWKHYGPMIFKKDNRFTYIFIVVLFIVLFLLMIV